MEQVPHEALPERDLWDLLPETTGSEKVDVLMELYRRHRQRGDQLQAASLAEQATAEAVSVDNFRLAANCKYSQGMALGAADQFEQALECFLLAAEYDGRTGDQGEVAVDLRMAGYTCRRLERLPEAQDHMQTAENLFLAVGRTEDAGDVTAELGELLFHSGRTEESLAVLDRARTHLRSVHEIEKVAAVDSLRADVLMSTGHIDEAIAILQDCIRVAESTKGVIDDAHAHRRLADAFMDQGRPDVALSHLDRARTLFAESDESVDVAACDRSAARCLRAMGNLEQAEKLLRSARAVFDAAGYDFDALRCDTDLAIACHVDGRFAEAVALNQRLVEAWQVMDEPELAYRAITRWADNLRAADEPGLCVELLRDRGGEFADSVSDEDRLWRQSILTQALQAIGDLPGALAAAEAGLAILPENVSAFSKAACYEVRGLNSLAADPHQAERDLGHAIALYLGSGQEERARALSRHFIPDQPATVPAQLGDNGDGTQPAAKPAEDRTGMYL